MKADERGERRRDVHPECIFSGHIINSYMTVILTGGELLDYLRIILYLYDFYIIYLELATGQLHFCGVR